MNALIVTALCLQLCFSDKGAPVLRGQQSTQAQTINRDVTTVSTNDFRQHALDLGNRLSDLLRQEIVFLSKISNTPISDLDRITIPGLMSALPSTSSAIQAPPSNQITINTYAGPTTQAGNPNNGPCTCTSQQYPSSQLQPSTIPSITGIEQDKPAYIPQQTQPQGEITSSYNQPQLVGSTESPQPQYGQTFTPIQNPPTNAASNGPLQTPQESPISYTFDTEKPLISFNHELKPSELNPQTQVGQTYATNSDTSGGSPTHIPTAEAFGQQPQENPVPYTFDTERPMFSVTHFQNPSTEGQLGQSSSASQYAQTPTNPQPSSNPPILQPQGNTNPLVVGNPTVQQTPGYAVSPQPQGAINPPAVANPVFQQPVTSNPAIGGGTLTELQPQQTNPSANPVLQDQQITNPPSPANPLFQQQVTSNPPLGGVTQTIPQPQQTNPPANPILQEYQPSLPVVANPLAQQSQPNMNPGSTQNPLTQNQQMNNPTVGTNTLGNSQPLQPTYTYTSNPVPTYQQVPSNHLPTYGTLQTQPNQQTYVPTVAAVPTTGQPQNVSPPQAQPELILVEPPKQSPAAPITG